MTSDNGGGGGSGSDTAEGDFGDAAGGGVARDAVPMVATVGASP